MQVTGIIQIDLYLEMLDCKNFHIEYAIQVQLLNIVTATQDFTLALDNFSKLVILYICYCNPDYSNNIDTQVNSFAASL